MVVITAWFDYHYIYTSVLQFYYLYYDLKCFFLSWNIQLDIFNHHLHGSASEGQ